MSKIIYIFIGLAAVMALHFTGALGAINLTHPIWRVNATLYGSFAGAVLSGFMFWASVAKPRLGRWLERLVMLGFVIILPVTLVSAKIFIYADAYNSVAVNIWHKGSYAVFITFVATVAALLAKLRIIGSLARG